MATIISAGIVYFAYLTIGDRVTHPFMGDLIVIVLFLLEGIMISIASEARFEVEEQKDEFIGFIVHELKNPLAAIKGYSQLLISKAKIQNNDKFLLYSQKIESQSDRMLEMINDLLDVTKIEVGKFSYEDEPFNITNIVEEVIMHQRLISQNRSIVLYGKSRKIINGDKYRIGQIITNLLTNAIKYSPEIKPVIVRIKENRNEVLVSVQDYGLGIPKNDLKKIFDRYYRINTVKRTTVDGAGIGLYVAKKIAYHHHGKLWVKSKLGKGSVFYLNLPILKKKQS